MHYKLGPNKELIPCSLEEWAESFRVNQVVRQDVIGDYKVSTVFLGVDHNFWKPGNPPVVFETMVFPNEAWVKRSSSWNEAVANHLKAIEWIRRGALPGEDPYNIYPEEE